MSLDRIDFDSISETDLQSLVDVGVPEGLTVEYKRQLYDHSDSGKREALKDLTAFANSSGGHLVVGIVADNGTPTQLTGTEIDNPDGEISRLENLLRDGVEPRISGIRIKAISLSSGGKILIVRVPKSWNPPHRVSAQGQNRFYLRNSAGVHEASVEELKGLFGLVSNMLQGISKFRTERIRRIAQGYGPVVIEGGGRLILHIVPTSSFGQYQTLDVRRIHEQFELFHPMGTMGMTPQFNFDGFANVCGGEKCHGYTQVFRSGIVEACMSHILDESRGSKILYASQFGNWIFEFFPQYLNGLRNLEVPCPMVVLISLEGVGAARLGIDGMEHQIDRIPPFRQPTMLLPEMIINDYGTELECHHALRAGFDALWNAAGYAQCAYFDASGRWVGSKHHPFRPMSPAN